MLRLQGVTSGYGDAMVLRRAGFAVEAGKIHCLLGRNGAGKTTAMKTIMGLLPLREGRILLSDQTLSDLQSHDVPKAGIGYIPQGRRLFSELSVAENLEIGLMTRGSGRHVRERVLDLFPRLRERLDQAAQTLSGGEQQMLATARALCIEPTVLILDEPTEGLQPSMIDLIQDAIQRLRDEGVAILLVEQRLDAILKLADAATFIENGVTLETVSRQRLHDDPSLLERYLGV